MVKSPASAAALPPAAGPPGRAPRHRRCADSGGDRDQPRPACRHGVSRKKSDPGDALVLANIIRTDMPMHRPLAADTDLAQAVAVLAQAHQDAVWSRQQVCNQLRSLLREYFPAFLEAFKDKQGG